VTGIPDATKGERLVVFFTDPGRDARDLWESLAATQLPRLWLPKRDDLHFVETLPTLGSGKLDLRAVRQMAMERQTAAAPRES
jgi:acyl-[acyl-carrier-protein]-phospholipid O-acyltransferase/long-chain-fatty-acid--[acyl-carrier-protein] ligase